MEVVRAPEPGIPRERYSTGCPRTSRSRRGIYPWLGTVCWSAGCHRWYAHIWGICATASRTTILQVYTRTCRRCGQRADRSYTGKYLPFNATLVRVDYEVKLRGN